MSKEPVITIPWTCQVCGREFDTPGGGICRRCNRVACNRHLKHILDEKDPTDEEGDRLVCENCLGEDESVESLSRWKWRLRFSR